jgi:hypothetical protein
MLAAGAAMIYPCPMPETQNDLFTQPITLNGLLGYFQELGRVLWVVAAMVALLLAFLLSAPFFVGIGGAYLAFSNGRFILGGIAVILMYRYGEWLFVSASDYLSSLF